MDLLTKSLLEDLLENPVTVAIYGGGFKPPTKGHFTVAEKTLEKYPEIDELKIFVGGGVRDGITQEESMKVWDIYKNYLSPKVIVEPSVSPVKSVLNYAKENPTHKVYWVLGAREDDKDDLKDIEHRTKTLEKYPNIEVKVITSSGGVSGTKTRQSINSNNKEQFFNLIPDVAEKEEIWDILKPAIKESKTRAQILRERKAKIEEGFIDNMKTKFQTFIKALKQEGKETKEAVKLLIKSAKGEIELTNEQKEQIGNQLKDVLKTIGLVGIAALPGGFIAAALLKIFKQTHLVTPSAFVNEVVTDTDVICDNCGWEWPIADGGDDLYICHKCGHDNNPDLEEGTCGYDTDVKTGKKLDTPGGLEEGKQVGLLYHFTSTNSLDKILKDNKINGSFMYEVGDKELYGVSTTRNKNLNYDLQRNNVRITLDGNKLSNNYKITPRDYFERQYNIPDNPQTIDEDEEVILTPKGYINNIKNYILAVDKVEDLEESRKKKPDPKKGTGKKPEGSGRRLYTDEDPKDTVRIKFKTKEDIVDTLNKKQFKAKSHARQSQVINLIHQRVRAAYGKAKDPEVKARLKRALDYIESRKESSKKKTERLRKMKEASDPQAGTALPYGSGFAPVKESKELNIQDLAYKQIPGLLEKGINYGLAHFRGFMKSSYKWSGPKDRNDFFDFIENIKGEIKRVPLSSIKPSQSGNDYKNSSSEYEAEEFQKILDGEKNIEDHRKEDFYPILVNKRDNKILDGNHRHYALSAINSPYAVVLYVDVPKQYLDEKSDPFGLNELAKDFVEEVFTETWNPNDSFLSLAVFMKDNGMNVTPLPKIKVISDDKENASHLLGKTAYYNPADKSITLYTFRRHPKDVLRSFAHEMVHHEQNLNGTLGKISTTNTNEDGHLEELEKEAYQKGNIMFRNWEDSIKNV